MKIGALTVAKAAVWFVYAVLVVYVVILTLAFILLLFGANPTAEFVDWVYRASTRIMQPFRGIFPPHAITDRAVFEPSYLFAIIIYTLFAVAVHALFDWLSVQSQRLRAERERDRYYTAMGCKRPPAPCLLPRPRPVARPTPGSGSRPRRGRGRRRPGARPSPAGRSSRPSPWCGGPGARTGRGP